MSEIVAENGKAVTDDMIAEWERALDRDEWPAGWRNVGDTVEGELPSSDRRRASMSKELLDS